MLTGRLQTRGIEPSTLQLCKVLLTLHNKGTGALCDSAVLISSVSLLSAQVIFRTLSSSSIKVMDPYSPATLARLSLTNLRIRLLKAQTCPTPLDPAGGERRSSDSTRVPTATQGLVSAPYYSIYTLLARGTCLCHGHAEHCVTHNTSQGGLQDSNVVRH